MMPRFSHVLSSRNIKVGFDLVNLVLARNIRSSFPAARRTSTSLQGYKTLKYFQTLSVSSTQSVNVAQLNPKVNKLILEVQIPLDRSTKVGKKMSDPKQLALNFAIIRYEPGAERFQFSFTLKSGKVFNFDRSVEETLGSFESRVMTNMGKKFKTTELTAKLVLPESHKKEDPLKAVLEGMLADSTEMFFQINDGDGINIQVNPPEVYSIKFHNKAFIGFPVLHQKLETSANFDDTTSIYKWEYTKDRIGKEISTKRNKAGKLIGPPVAVTWHSFPNDSGNTAMITPDDSLEGASIRITCTPSDGKRFGLPFTEEFPSPLQKIPVPPSHLLYEERLSRLHPIDSKDPNVLRIVSYNILADTYATPEWFNNSPAESLEFSYRLPLLRKELSSYNADIICLQEVDEKAFIGDFQPFLKAAGNLNGNFSCKVGNTREGVAAFYNPEKLKLLECKTVTILEVMKQLPFWSVVSSNVALATRLEDRNTVLHISVLENKNAGKSLLVLGVTHLYFHPTADHIRLLQTMVCARSLEARVAELKQQYPDRQIRVFFCGDFNCTPPYGAYRLLTSGKVGTNDDDWVYHEPEKLVPGIEFEHHLQLSNSHTEERLTNITLNFEGCIDYILYQAEKTELIEAYPPPDKSTIASIVGCKDYQLSLPNFYTPSDHLPLIADFKLLS